MSNTPSTTARFLPDAPAAVEPAYQQEPLFVEATDQPFLRGFVEECGEHIEVIERTLLQIEQHPHDSGAINDLFRPFHTIKGVAGFLNLRDIHRLAHEVETILDRARRRGQPLARAGVEGIFAALDLLKAQIGPLAQYAAAPSDGPIPQPDMSATLDRLRGLRRAVDAAEPAIDAKAQSGIPASGRPAPEAQRGDTTIRVDPRKLDALMDAVSELVIAHTPLGSEGLGADAQARDRARFNRVVRNIQDATIAMRMIPIGQSFERMRRVVRDVAHKSGKDIDLQIDGAQTELDASLAQRLADPLIHLIRNAIDHGIETPAERAARGKPRAGVLRLCAIHDREHIVIEISDDGRGLVRDAILRKATERGLVRAGAALTEDQVFDLIMAPGFSTAKTVSDISGRGVGLDIVRRGVESLRGALTIHSKPGHGATFRIRLPLTLAIIDGLLVRTGGQRLVVPLGCVAHSIRPGHVLAGAAGDMVDLRGAPVPLLQIGEAFGYCKHLDPCRNVVVVIGDGDHRRGIVVEELIGIQSVVIKPLGRRFAHLRDVCGATILGDGRVALIVDPAALASANPPPPVVAPEGRPAPAAGATPPVAGKYFTFVLAGAMFGVAMAQVCEVASLGPITPLPHTPHYLKGLIHLRGALIPVIDLRARLGLPAADHNRETCVVVVHPSDPIGLIVDHPPTVTQIAQAPIGAETGESTRLAALRVDGLLAELDAHTPRA